MGPLYLRPTPQADELWLSRPPYLMIARILAVEVARGGRRVVSYELYDEGGTVLETVEHAALDDGWWRAFQPLERRFG